MPMQQFDETAPLTFTLSFTNADTPGVASTLVPAGSIYRSRIDEILLTNSDSVDHAVTLSVQVGGTDYGLGSVNVPAGAGTAGVAAVPFLATAYPGATWALVIAGQANLRATFATAITAATQLDLVAIGGTV